VRYISLAWKKQLLFVLVTTPVLMEKALKFPCFFNAFFKKLHQLAWKILKHNAFCISIYTGLDGKSMDIFPTSVLIENVENVMLSVLITTPVLMEKALKFPCFFNAFFKKLHRLAWKILKHNAFCISIYTGLDGKSMDISLLFQCFFQKTTSVWMEISMLFLLITTSVSM